MSRVLIVLGVVLIFVVGVFFLFNAGDDLGESVVKTSPPKHTSAPTDSPASTTSSAPPATTPLPRPIETLPVETKPPVEYPDASVGTYKLGDKVFIPEYGVRGRISGGTIEDGKVSSSYLFIENEEGQTILKYDREYYESLGHLEMISYPQRGDVIMKQNGKELDICLKYSEAANFDTYVDVVFAPNERHPSVVEKLTC